MTQKKSKYQLQRIIPFKIQQTAEKDTCLFTTTRSERRLVFPRKLRIKSSSNLEMLPSEPSVFTKSISDASMLTLPSSIPTSSISPTFEENIARISNLRYNFPTSRGPLPPLKRNLSVLHDSPEKEVIGEVSEDEEQASELMLKRSIGFWTVLRCEGPYPQSCEGPQMAVVDSMLVVCGGENQARSSDLKVLDWRTRRWRVVRAINGPKGRLGHSMVGYRQKVVIFGGWITNKTHERVTARKMLVFSMDNNRWEKCLGSGQVPSPRKYHAACLLGRDMLVYGGIDGRNQITDELFILDIAEKVWTKAEVSRVNDPGPRSHCTFTPVFHQSLKTIYDFHIDKIPVLKEKYSLINSGFYLFGGLKNNSQPSDELHTLHIRSGKLVWTEAKCMGIGPSARHSHTAHAIHSSLFIYGGRNDATNGRSQTALNDLFVYNVMNFKWEKVEVFGSVPEGRWGHGMTGINTSLIVFGGLTYGKFMAAELYMLETSRVEAEKRIQAEKKMTRMLTDEDED
jgi:N-acetylneuraminic acid mutarotase